MNEVIQKIADLAIEWWKNYPYQTPKESVVDFIKRNLSPDDEKISELIYKAIDYYRDWKDMDENPFFTANADEYIIARFKNEETDE